MKDMISIISGSEFKIALSALRSKFRTGEISKVEFIYQFDNLLIKAGCGSIIDVMDTVPCDIQHYTLLEPIIYETKLTNRYSFILSSPNLAEAYCRALIIISALELNVTHPDRLFIEFGVCKGVLLKINGEPPFPAAITIGTDDFDNHYTVITTNHENRFLEHLEDKSERCNVNLALTKRKP